MSQRHQVAENVNQQSQQTLNVIFGDSRNGFFSLLDKYTRFKRQFNRVWT